MKNMELYNTVLKLTELMVELDKVQEQTGVKVVQAMVELMKVQEQVADQILDSE